MAMTAMADRRIYSFLVLPRSSAVAFVVREFADDRRIPSSTVALRIGFDVYRRRKDIAALSSNKRSASAPLVEK